MRVPGRLALRLAQVEFAMAVGLAALPGWGQRVDSGTGTAPAAIKPPFAISKETTAITGPVRADGTVDYVAAVNERYGKGATPLNNGFVIWLSAVGTDDGIFDRKIEAKVLQMCGAAPTPPRPDQWINYASFLQQIPGLTDPQQDALWQVLADSRKAPWKETDHPELAAYLQYQANIWAVGAIAADRPKWWAPLVSRDGRTLSSAALYGLGYVRDFSDTFCARATLRAGSGDFAGFLSDITTARKLARLLASGPTTVERLVGLLAERNAVEAMAGVAGSGIFTAAQCKSALDSFDALPPMPTIVESLDVMERWTALDIAADVATGFWQTPPDGQNVIDTDHLGEKFQTVDRKLADWNQVLKEINGIYDRQLQAERVPGLAQMGEQCDALSKQLDAAKSDVEPKEKLYDFGARPGENQAAYSHRMAYGIAGELSSNMRGAEEIIRRTTMETQMAQMVLLAAEVKARTGQWPALADELSAEMALKYPRNIYGLPRDIYSKESAEAVRYLITPAGVRVYSVGRNGKDDGGVSDAPRRKDDILLGPG